MQFSHATKDIEKHAGAALHGLFSIVDGVSERNFMSAFQNFYGHLEKMGFVRSYRMMRREPLIGFGAALPEFEYHVEIEFSSLELEQECYDYVNTNEEPIRSLHRAMNSKVKPPAYFFLGSYI
jgi:hypothetical protein